MFALQERTNDMLSEEQKKVKKILLTPIECTTQETLTVFLYNNRIFSSQKYNGFDPDMSDFAVGFYQVIYKEKLAKLGHNILDEKGNLKVLEKYKEFCGDTMNSYNTIEKRLNDDIKKKLKNKYHCLANFWILPMDVGHSSSWTITRDLGKYSKSKKGIDDYMDKFLEYYLENNEEYSKVYPEYTKSFMLDTFATDHFLKDIYIENNEVTESMKFSYKEVDDIANEMCKRIEKRAELIALEKGTELYKFFLDLGIIQLI